VWRARKCGTGSQDTLHASKGMADPRSGVSGSLRLQGKADEWKRGVERGKEERQGIIELVRGEERKRMEEG